MLFKKFSIYWESVLHHNTDILQSNCFFYGVFWATDLFVLIILETYWDKLKNLKTTFNISCKRSLMVKSTIFSLAFSRNLKFLSLWWCRKKQINQIPETLFSSEVYFKTSAPYRLKPLVEGQSNIWSKRWLRKNVQPLFS